MKVKHLKNKTTIEITSEEFEKYRTITNDLDTILGSIFECQDMWLSDIGKLDTLRFRLTELLGLTWNRDTHSYIKEGK